MPSDGTTTQRGYGYQHKKLRAQVKRMVDAGKATCWRCGEPIERGADFDLGHDDHDRTKYRGPEHQACNRATAGRRKRRPPQPGRRAPALKFFD